MGSSGKGATPITFETIIIKYVVYYFSHTPVLLNCHNLMIAEA